MKMENDIRDKIERWKIKAEIFLKNDTKAFIIDVTDQYYFCEVIFVGEDCIHVQSFTGKLIHEKSRIYWSDVLKLEEYKEKGK